MLSDKKSGQASAQPFIAMINENEQALQIHALKNLNKMVDYAWHEIADTLPKM
tara:strand:+ start:117 stop:275 length:159 start_codon:yes stop_codon:yes gene_type:complete